MALRFSHFLSASDLESGLGTDSGPVKNLATENNEMETLSLLKTLGPGMNCECIYVGKDFWICDCLDTVIGSCDSTYIHRSSPQSYCY